VSVAAATRHLVLVGLMGVGKTTVGRLAAAALGWPLSDSDTEIQALEGATVRELQERGGAAALHTLEARILLGALAAPEPSVICAAASTIDDERCRAALRGRGVTTVWLTAALATLVARYDSDRHRPRYPQGTQAALAAQLAARADRFASVASATVAVDDLGPEQVLERLAPVLAGISP
jgi:shikimate kinase